MASDKPPPPVRSGRHLPDTISAVPSLTSKIITGLNDAQRTAVTTPARVLQILAPPGSGKTRTLTSRVAYLLSGPDRLTPENVIVATFTVKAAREMKERLSTLVGEGVERRLLLGTFHSVARRYLLKYGYLVGLPQGWGIADAADTRAICQRAIKRRKLTDVIDAKHLQSRISHFKARNLSPQVNDRPICHSTQPSTQQKQKRQQDIADEDFVLLYEDYHAALVASNLLDYDDLLLRCLEMLKQHPRCVSNVEAVLIDEFQDTNIVQFELMKYFAWREKRITIVGDPDQSIYGFRAAEIGNVRRMRALYSDTVVVNLEQNYRSSASILHAALEVIRQDTSRPDKSITPTHAIGPRPVLRRVPTPALEAAWIVNEIKRLRAVTAGVIGYSGVAILVRSAPLTRQIETALAKDGVPYKMVGGTRFFDRAEVKVVLDYLRVLQNPLNNDALSRVINVPPRGVGDATIKKLMETAEAKKKSLWEFVCKAVRGDLAWGFSISKQVERVLGSFTALLVTSMNKLDGGDSEQSLTAIVEMLLSKLNYRSYLERVYPEDHDGRWANITEVLSQTHEACSNEDDESLPQIDGVDQQSVVSKSRFALDRFLANAALVNEKLPTETLEHGEVTISTIHASKGLEWPVVFVPAVYAGSIPHSRAEDTDEERRLLYVAMTRAQALLAMSCPNRSPSDKTTLSPFLDEPKVMRLLEGKASNYHFTDVQTVARILSVPCPSETEIEASIEAGTLPSRYDDQIPHKDPSDENNSDNQACQTVYERKRKWDGGPGGGEHQPGWKRLGGLTTTEDQLKKKMTTADKIGFQSARSHLSETQRHKHTCHVAVEEGRIKNASRQKMTRAGSSEFSAVTTQIPTDITTINTEPKHKKVDNAASSQRPKGKPSLGQQTLTTFFMKKQPEVPSRPMNATEVIKVLRKTDMPLRDQMESLPQPIIPKRPTKVILLSSSPREHSRASRENTIHQDKLNDTQRNTAPFTTSGSYKAVMRDPECAEGGEPSLPALPPPRPPSRNIRAGGAAPVGYDLSGRRSSSTRRTLGIRRSLNGWQNRRGRRG